MMEDIEQKWIEFTRNTENWDTNQGNYLHHDSKRPGHPDSDNKDHKESRDGSKISQIIATVDKFPLEEQLVFCVNVLDKLDAVVSACQKKLDIIEETQRFFEQSKQLDLGTVLSYARRISSHVRAPPEYLDPTGSDPFCVPGYFFPCPNRLMMSRSALFYAHMTRAVPPLISCVKNPDKQSTFTIHITTSTPSSSIFYVINNLTSWNQYCPNKKPLISQKGNYIIQSYCQAEGFLPSEVNIVELTIGEEAQYFKQTQNAGIGSGAPDGRAENSVRHLNSEIVSTRQERGGLDSRGPKEKAKESKASSLAKFRGLLLSENIDDEDDDDDDDNDDDDDDEDMN